SGYGNKKTGSLGIDYDLNADWTVGVAGNTGFKAPGFNDLYWPASPWSSGNSDLAPEVSRNFEAHITYTSDQTVASLTIFQNKIRDLIALQGTPSKPYNVNRARIRGVTLSADHWLTSR